MTRFAANKNQEADRPGKLDDSIRVFILTCFTLSRNPRATKEAAALAAAGCKVTVLGAWSTRAEADEDLQIASHYGFSFKSVARFDDERLINKGKIYKDRLRGRVARFLYQRFRIESPDQLGYFTRELLKAAQAAKADYYICHLEQALWVGQRLLDAGMRVGVDMEDWYSEDLLPGARRQRPLRLLHSLEGSLLRGCAHSSTTSQSMSQALVGRFGCRPPLVLYNAFEWSDRGAIDGILKDRVERKKPSIHWYSQTLGPGRGLEDLFAALPHVKYDVEVHLRGNLAKDFTGWIHANSAEAGRTKVFLHPLVSNAELLSRISEHDIGFAGEQKYCLSRDLTVTNKIMHYLLGGLAVVASDTAGQREIAQQAGAGVCLYRSGDPTDLAAQLNLLLENRQRLDETKAAALRAAEETFCWERQAPKLIDSVQAALRRDSMRT